MKLAIFTIVRNEQYLLPIWLKHYRNIVDCKDIWILDNGSTDGSTKCLPCNVIVKESSTSFNATWLLATVKDFQSKLLDWYDYVIFSEVDELIFHRKNELFKYIKYSDKNIIRCNGYEIVHQINIEKPIDLEKPIFKQRSKWYNSLQFCKPLISRVPIAWRIGFHHNNSGLKIDPNVVLVHLHKLDYDLAVKRNAERRNVPIDQTSYKKRYGWQNWLGEEGLKTFFKKATKPIGNLEDIPDWIKEYDN